MLNKASPLFGGVGSSRGLKKKQSLLPTSTYACQIWETQFMKQGSEFDSSLQTAHLCILKGVLGVKRSMPNWAVLRECG